MKKTVIIFITILLLLSVGCTSEKVSVKDNVKIHSEYHVFEGQSDNWMGKITVDYTETFTEVDGKWRYSSQMNPGSEGYLYYKGFDVDKVKNLYFEVVNGASKRSGTMERLYKSAIVLGSDVYRSDDVFTVTVKWNGLEESFQMKAIQSKIFD